MPIDDGFSTNAKSTSGVQLTSIGLEDDLSFMQYTGADNLVDEGEETDQGYDAVDQPTSSDYPQFEENINLSDEESLQRFEFWYSPSGSGNMYCIPNVPDSIRPKNGQVYSTMAEAMDMYYKYADHAGFDVRKYTSRKANGDYYMRQFVCNREGQPNTSDLDTCNPKKNRARRVDMHRRGCMAGIKCQISDDGIGFILSDVEETHNHKLFSKEQMMMSKSRRKLSFYQRSYCYKMNSQNIGGTVAHRLYSEIQGGIHYVQGTKDDFKNCIRDLNCHIGGCDAHLLVTKLTNRKNNVCNFSFEFRQENKVLNSLFWADDTSKLQYEEFGDVVSFDATFRTNRYDMVYVPFTGIDNHRRCVTFGGALLSREDGDSYIWLLSKFLETFKKAPSLILSDQSLAMKKAIKHVFPNSRHRLCMWHITSKLSVKVADKIFKSEGFKSTFNSLVWNSRLEPYQFEEGWDAFIAKYNLGDNQWFSDMRAVRQDWIPAYFKDVPLSGLMRTTSRSESENKTFQNAVNPGTNLNNFMTAFESAMERQRFNQGHRDFNDVEKYPLRKTDLIIETKAYMYYTREVFLLVQKELYHSIYSCSQFNCSIVDDLEVWLVREKVNTSDRIIHKDPKKHDDIEDPTEWDDNLIVRDFEVKVKKDDSVFICSCMLFEHRGILCRHIFCLMKWHGINEIPEKYLLRRWRKDLIPLVKLRWTFRYGDMDETVDKMAIDAFSSVDHMLHKLTSSKDKLKEYIQCVLDLEKKFESSCSIATNTDKTAEFDQLLGVTKPTVVEINNPSGIVNIGRPKRTRIKSKMEIAKEKKEKWPTNMCSLSYGCLP